MSTVERPAPHRVDTRQILALAVPAFFTLIAEPLFLLADTAIVGHVGTTALAGLGVASAALLTVVNLCVFLAYSTTATVARRMGAGQRDEAIAVGIDGIWLALLLGGVLALLLAWQAGPVCAVFGGGPGVVEQASTYLRISAAGVPAMLVVLAATGLLRGLQDTRTPLVVATVGFGVNLLLNVVLVLGMGMGVAGSATGTVLAQWGMALAYLLMVVRLARVEHARLHANPTGVLASAVDGLPLLVRTLALRAVLLLTTWVAAGLGAVPLAAHQVAMTVWSFLAFALDAIAIAAQALTGRWLGEGDVGSARAATATMMRWGVGYGVVLGALVALGSPWLPALFTPDPAVRAALVIALVVVGLGQPVCGLAFVLDGVLIGAGDGRWLAVAQVVMLLLYVPAAWTVHIAWPGVVPLWCAFTWFMVVRAALLWWRARSDAWLRV